VFGVIAVVGVALGMLASAGAASGAYPRCFGAASRDPHHRCSNPKLKLSVVPRPKQALITPNAPCAPIPATVKVCAFGVPATKAAGTVALVGDSHAEHWRAALEVVTRARRWSGLSITEPSCPFTLGTPVAPKPKRDECSQWNQEVIRWFAEHPSVSTVFTSDHPGLVMTSPGQSEQAAKVAGITAGWNALPATVKHIVVIRDVPYMHQDTLPCVQRAIAKRKDAGLVCAVPRRRALHLDPDLTAAQQLHSARVQVVDLTNFLCGGRLCYPVVGGALVYRDSFEHLTRVFARTLGPFLLSRVARLMTSWH
jgi:hypothetical protein